MSENLLNKTAVRTFILQRVKDTRPGWNCTQVSPAAIRKLEVIVEAMVDRAVHSHPSLGKTFTEVI